MTQPKTASGPQGFNAEVTSAQESNEQHRYSDKDQTEASQHHTLGPEPLQAAPGDHNHDGRNSASLDSRYLAKGTATSVIGSKSDSSALTNLLNALAAKGIITNNTSP